jgi:hypothetical protein
MELLFNELSLAPLSNSDAEAEIKILQFLDTFRAAQKKGFTKIRSDHRLDQIKLTNEIDLLNWALRENHRTHLNLILGLLVSPFLDTDVPNAFEKYDNAVYTFESIPHNYPATPCAGLAAASIQELPAISLSSEPLWGLPILTVTITAGESVSTDNVLNISHPNRFAEDDIELFLENYGDLILPVTTISPADKNVHLSDHHGKAELKELSDRLRLSPHVIEMWSTDWGGRNFIRKIKKDGVIEVVLIKTQKRYALLIQTTGTNYRQTKAIAELIDEKYS